MIFLFVSHIIHPWWACVCSYTFARNLQTVLLPPYSIFALRCLKNIAPNTNARAPGQSATTGVFCLHSAILRLPLNYQGLQVSKSVSSNKVSNRLIVAHFPTDFHKAPASPCSLVLEGVLDCCTRRLRCPPFRWQNQNSPSASPYKVSPFNSQMRSRLGLCFWH